MFISDPNKNKATHATALSVINLRRLPVFRGQSAPAVKCFITSCTPPLYRVCTREKGARYVLKAHSLFDAPCQG